MNRLSQIKISPVYNTDEDVKSFYNDVLSVAKSYKRVSAYFNGGIFKYISKGFTKLLQNGGNMKLVLSSEVDSDTFSQIKKGYELRDKNDEFIVASIKNHFVNLEKYKSELSILSFLIAIGRLDVKIAFRTKGIFHDKYGIIEDGYGDKVLFSGSNNETEAAIEYNHESFETTPSWGNPSQNEKEKIRIRELDFDEIWNNTKDKLIVLPITEVIEDNLISQIDYSKINKLVEKFDFLRVSIDHQSMIYFQSNFQIDTITRNYYFKLLAPYVINKGNNSLQIMGLKSYRDILRVKEILSSTARNLNFQVYYSKSFNELIEKYYLDMSELSKLGLLIKDKDAIKDNKNYIDFKTRVNGLLKRSLRDAQSIAAYHLVSLRKTMNFSVPGSGKTASILGAFEYLSSLDVQDSNYVNKMLVIGPINCFKSWKDEYALVSKEYNKRKPDDVIDIKDFEGLSTKTMILKYDFPKARIVLINFEIVTSLEDDLASLVDDKTLIVFDEIHRIKRIDSEKYKSCKRIIDKSRFRVALTGTPLPNGYEDLINIFNLLYGPYSESYFRMYIDELRNSDRLFNEQGIENDSLNNLIFPFYIRTTKDELKVPKANPDNLIHIETSKWESDLYFNTIDESNNHFETAVKLVEVGCIPEKLSRKDNERSLSLLIGNPVFEEEFSDLVPKSTSKLDRLISLVKENRRKSIIWCVFIDTINTVYSLLKNEGFKVVMIYGKTSIDERNEIIDKFNNTNEYEILITNPHTLAESVSLHKSCHDAYYLELNYNLAQFLQSKDRIHRLGLNENDITNYYILINKYGEDIENSIDYKMYSRLCKKEIRMKNAIEQGRFFTREENHADDIKIMISEIANRSKHK